MKKFLMYIGGGAVILVVLFIALFVFTSATSEKLVCQSKEGNITIMYNDKTITGYTANGITYDMDGQKAIAEQIGIENYISQFNTWFQTNTTGTCQYDN